MNLLAHGIDVVDIADITRLLIPPMAEELSTIFTTGELSYCGESNLKIERLAGRLAIKEAVLKALGTGFGEDIGFVDVEVVTLTSGQPTVKLHDKAALVAKTLGITSWIVSSTHTAQYAFASVIGLA